MNKIPTKNFRLRRETKAMMATILDPHKRGEFKRAMIQAQLHSEERPAPSKRGGGRGDGQE
jgi:hypothetical protein